MSEQDMDELLALVERHLGKSWREVVNHLRDLNELDDIAARVHQGDYVGAVQGVEDAAKAFGIAQHEAYIDAGKAAASYLDGEVDALVRFDVKNHRAVQWADRNEAELIRGLSDEQRDLVRRVIRDGVAAGRNPREVARDIRDSIGLTDAQAQIVANYRKALESGDFANAIDRELTDGRDDRSVAAAQRAGKVLTPKQIDGMVERYRSNWVDYRATTIARTEGLRIAHQGSREAFKQAIDAGHVDADELERKWNHKNIGKDSREEHEAMDGETVGIDDAFSNGLMYPGDPDGDPSETLNCRCVVSTRLV